MNSNSSEENDYPEWQTNLSKYSKGIKKLHYEIFDYTIFHIPDENYKYHRNLTLNLFNQILKSYYPSTTYFLFGSSIQNLEIKNSNINISILCELCCTNSNQIYFLENLKEILIIEDFSYQNNIEIIYSKIPYLKAFCKYTNFQINISLNQTEKIEFSQKIKNFILKHPILKYMIIFIKKFFEINNLKSEKNEGMNSYSILILVIHFYQNYISKKDNLINLNFGDFFIQFLRYYVYNIDYKNYGISIKDGGKIFKIKNQFKYKKINSLEICIENYIEDDDFNGINFKQFNEIYSLFKMSLHKIIELLEKPEKDFVSFLREIGFD